MISAEEKKQIRQKGYADIGGIPRKRYWTPDGREVFGIPSMRTFIIKEGNKVIEEGIRDANLDKGWLAEKPKKPKPHCPHCNKWHNTQNEINACGQNKRAFDEEWQKKAKQMQEEPSDLRAEVESMKSDMGEIKNMLLELIKKE